MIEDDQCKGLLRGLAALESECDSDRQSEEGTLPQDDEAGPGGENFTLALGWRLELWN